MKKTKELIINNIPIVSLAILVFIAWFMQSELACITWGFLFN